MHKTLALSLLMTAALFTSAHAAPANQDACNSLAFDLAEKASKKKLAEANALKVDKLIAKLESQCADGKLAEAGATAKEVEAAIK